MGEQTELEWLLQRAVKLSPVSSQSGELGQALSTARSSGDPQAGQRGPRAGGSSNPDLLSLFRLLEQSR